MTPETKLDLAEKWWQRAQATDAVVRVKREPCPAGHWITTKTTGGRKVMPVDETPILFKRGDAR